jgi:phytoene synthase
LAGVAELDRDKRLNAAYARCAEITRQASSNFYYAFMLLPVERRRALYAVYAFCRYIDDIADDGAVREPAALLQRWRAELNRVYTGTVERPVPLALADNVYRFNIPQRYFEEVIDGVEMDLTRKRYATFDELSLYCRRVASAVGLICIEIFGYRNPGTRIYAERLGIAFQLTNIIRDVGEDAARDRIYIPAEDLRRFGVPEADILESRFTSAFGELMAYEASRAREFYTQAEMALAPEDHASMVSAEGMRLIYSALLDQIVDSGYRVMGQRMRVSTPRKLYLVGRAWAGAHWARAS